MRIVCTRRKPPTGQFRHEQAHRWFRPNIDTILRAAHGKTKRCSDGVQFVLVLPMLPSSAPLVDVWPTPHNAPPLVQPGPLSVGIRAVSMTSLSVRVLPIVHKSVLMVDALLRLHHVLCLVIPESHAGMASVWTLLNSAIVLPVFPFVVQIDRVHSINPHVWTMPICKPVNVLSVHPFAVGTAHVLCFPPIVHVRQLLHSDVRVMADVFAMSLRIV